MVNPILSKSSVCLIARKEREGNTQFSSMETNETSVASKNVLKGVQTHSQLEH